MGTRISEIIFGNDWKGIISRMACVGVFFIFAIYPNFEIIFVSGSSMHPTLKNRDLIILKKYAYDYHPPEINDIVVLTERSDRTKIVKRIVAGPGESVDICDGILCINGKPDLRWSGQVSYKLNKQLYNKVPEYCYFYIGDNRGDTSLGIVNLDQIQGKVMFHD